MTPGRQSRIQCFQCVNQSKNRSGQHSTPNIQRASARICKLKLLLACKTTSAVDYVGKTKMRAVFPKQTTLDYLDLKLEPIGRVHLPIVN